MLLSEQKNWNVVEELKYSHEMVDTCNVLHANHASQNVYQTTVTVGDGMNVMILCL